MTCSGAAVLSRRAADSKAQDDLLAGRVAVAALHKLQHMGWRRRACVVVRGECRMRSSASSVSSTRGQLGPSTGARRCATLNSVRSACARQRRSEREAPDAAAQSPCWDLHQG